MPAMAAAGAEEAVRPAQPEQRRAALLLGAEGLPKRLVAQTTHARCNFEPHNRDPLMQNVLRTYIPTGGVSRISRKPIDKLRFLPPYSPDLNPIEMAFSKFKADLKRRAARTVTELWDAIGHATDIFTPAECQNHFAAAGYDRV